ncbi:WD40 repeat-containing protein HOS15-like isoform X3 [Zingiber officinale]|uniref:WD40 repeat-containing protein HOS15-like isoform X3 n=1 Tax=Zingiber officinale TaxID=94328 RepID=UPI001C4C4305|nr:WD40 repeat-containing protein HOS15-like isoform X3 [Zingiber officinale]
MRDGATRRDNNGVEDVFLLGLTHASFVLGYEAGIHNFAIDGNLVPPDALVTLVQKGLRYVKMEANLDNNDVDSEDDFSFLQPLDLITKSVDELQIMVKAKREEKIQKESDRIKDNVHAREQEQFKGETPGGRQKKDGDQEDDKDKMDVDDDQGKVKERVMKMEKRHSQSKVKSKLGKHKVSRGPKQMDNTPSSQSLACEISSSEVTILEGHGSEIFACAWSPAGSLLASGSGDSTARIWKVPDGPSCKDVQILPSNVHILKHFKGRANEKCKDVTTLDWNDGGSLLATGCYDGQARVWSPDGELRSTLAKHEGAIFSLKWNKKGDFLLSGSVDKTTIVWDTNTWECKQQFKFHSAPIFDIDWKNNCTFASCSADNMIYVCKVGETCPLKAFSGHKAEVNAAKWDPTQTLLASCSDDGTAKIWSLKEDKYLHDFRDHSKEIYTIRWRPIGPCTNTSNQVLATASYDSTIKLWDIEHGHLLCSLNGHKDAVYSIAFSPNGEYLASGALDRSLHIWSIKEGRLVKTYQGPGGIFEVCWNREGDKVAACFSDKMLFLNNIITVMDFRM